MSKRKPLLNHDPAAALPDGVFIMYLHMLLFLFELSNFVTSFVVGAIAVPLNYIGNVTLKICSRYKTLVFFFCFVITDLE